MRFRITNRSAIRLPYLSVDVRGVDLGLGGRHFLEVAHIGPGETSTVELSTYDQALYPGELEKLHDFEYLPTPEPLPEDKDGYKEFNGLL